MCTNWWRAMHWLTFFYSSNVWCFATWAVFGLNSFQHCFMGTVHTILSGVFCVFVSVFQSCASSSVLILFVSIIYKFVNISLTLIFNIYVVWNHWSEHFLSFCLDINWILKIIILWSCLIFHIFFWILIQFIHLFRILFSYSWELVCHL